MSRLPKYKSNNISQKIGYFIGAAGVESTENLTARRAGVIFEVPMLMAALWLLMNWWAESRGVISGPVSNRYDMLLWGLFVLESTLLSYLVTNTKRYLLGNWLNLVIILLGLPMLIGWQTHMGILRLLRLMIVFSLLLHVGAGVKKMLSRNELGATLIASLIVIVMAGIMIAGLDPAIESPADGIWWAWVTVTTVGYGDVVPTSTAGRIFASLIILLGIGLFSMITATFAAYFISQKENELIDEERENHRRMCDMDDRLYRVEEKLETLLNEIRENRKP